jgi:tetratricopeptide (TPR) repeat protein
MNNPLETMINQAIQAFQSGNLNSTENILNRVLAAHSKNLPALHILGLVKASQSKHKEAAELLKRAIRLNPNDPSLHYNLAKALQESGADNESLPHHKKAVALNPSNPEAWLSYGKSLSNLGFNVDALDAYKNSLKINPSYVEAFLNIGATLKDLDRYDEALNYADKAIAINPTLSGAWSNRGIALKELKRYEEALISYDKAINLKPDYHEAWSNQGVTLNELKRYEEALFSYDKAINLKSDYYDAYFNKALTQLVTGNFEGGWQNYEYRWKKNIAKPIRHQQFPLLTNLSEISGKSVLVWCEQGYGDTIQFSRFIEKLLELTADVVFEVQKPLKALFENSFMRPKVISQEESTGAIDFQIPLVSLPHLFSINLYNIPSANAYIKADEKNSIFWRD